MTAAAEKFIDGISIAWDSREPWEATAEKGMSEVDEKILATYCEQTGDDYAEAEAEVLSVVRAKVTPGA